MSRFARFNQFNEDERVLLEEALIQYDREAMDNDDFYGTPEKDEMMKTRKKLIAEMGQ